ncbi:hypothetical protein ASH00_06935 [Arthrobacter sp. Soil782]|uniref:hypothetical protein n=1 Tax=Arthrobacter sp. Soil782 TaxID=1736410 RepID=UPI0007010D39|nr:hypothetical protein [Arthrobacter sp. Soil782]KRF09353.1 hypothetical protein ASH00_06935 [Arthrobacter sp. Soil782]
MSSVESLPQLTARETTTFLSKVFVPTLAKGPIIRKPPEQEAEDLLRVVGRSGALSWDEFIQSWYRMVRRVVFTDAAAHDSELTDMRPAPR